MNKGTEIFASKHSKKILTAHITGIEERSFNEKPTDCAIIQDFDGYKIILPSFVMNVREDRSVLRSLVGSEIDFIVVGIQEDEKIAVASRLAAMEIKRKADLIKHEAGETISCRVVAIGASDIVVEFMGLETKINKKEVDYGYIKDLRKYAQVGDRIQAKILEIDAENQILQLSMKALKPSPIEIVEKNYPKNSEHAGKIVNIENFGIFIELQQGIVILCPPPNWSNFNPNIGDTYLVRIKRIDRERERVSGTLVRLIKTTTI
ncbi:30S ribosomal protein S1 [Clostridium botulinum]|uniref:S1 RNA-binding domain-containing protein n=1 Tax=Clostridium botulinum TaxID=1491 RepID=UPI00174D3D45|nr:S1 RNA-binding domain-containing protein [Clostridium botulinum]MBD5639888.1 30S ribosomal protein S1 [Clostridium botulinum]MDI6919059.1 S1 RNA-binding domain-containing protein [Clostridium botulinum]WMU99724.1 S1 RNA-binding domain-containing protein [Clostridium botulinum]